MEAATRENSGSGKGKNNERDPTLDEHAAADRKGPAQRSALLDDQDPPDITGNAQLKGEDPSPGDRTRGETSAADRTAPIDNS
jgi:hypothetical protein